MMFFTVCVCFLPRSLKFFLTQNMQLILKGLSLFRAELFDMWRISLTANPGFDCDSLVYYMLDEVQVYYMITITVNFARID